MAKTIIDMKGIVKKFYIGQPNELTILKGINLNVEEGEFVSIVGQSLSLIHIWYHGAYRKSWYPFR